jgi:hypothetical protein
VPRRFYVQLRECDLVVLVVAPAIAWEVSRTLKITDQAGATIPLRHGEFCEYRVHMEWFQGKLFFMRGWEDMVNMLTMRKDYVRPRLRGRRELLPVDPDPSHVLRPAGDEVQAPWPDGGEVI